MIINRHQYSLIILEPSHYGTNCVVWVRGDRETGIHFRNCQFRDENTWVRTEYANAYGLPYVVSAVFTVIAP